MHTWAPNYSGAIILFEGKFPLWTPGPPVCVSVCSVALGVELGAFTLSYIPTISFTFHSEADGREAAQAEFELVILPLQPPRVLGTCAIALGFQSFSW